MKSLSAWQAKFADMARTSRERGFRQALERGYHVWQLARHMKATEVAKNIERHFTTDLERYNFDKTHFACHAP